MTATFWIKALQLIASLGLLVFIHELGHFMWARLFGVRVEKFYLFFDIGLKKLGINWDGSIFKFKPSSNIKSVKMGNTIQIVFILLLIVYTKKILIPTTVNDN